MLQTAIDHFLDAYEKSRKQKTFWAYQLALKQFVLSCNKKSLAQIGRDDMLDYAAFLRRVGLSARTVASRFEYVMTFLKAQKISGFLEKGDWPQYVEEEPEPYEPEDLEKFFAVCDPTERLWFRFFLQTGMRDKEVAHATWDDVNLGKGAVRVRAKEQFAYTPKAYKARTIPIPDTREMAKYGTVLPRTNIEASIGAMRTCSIVPRSFSRTIDNAVEMAAEIIAM